LTAVPQKLASKSGTARSAPLVESFGSWPDIDAQQDRAVRARSRAIGPAWSSDEAKATMPQREQRP
jgi:hypothetical protein